MSLFSEALKFSTIVSLSLNNRWIDDTGLNFLGKAISVNMHLKELSIIENPFTVNGMINFLMHFLDALSPISCVVIDDHIYEMLQNLPQHQILLSCLNYVQQQKGRRGFMVIPYNLAFDLTTTDRPFAHESPDTPSLISRFNAV